MVKEKIDELFSKISKVFGIADGSVITGLMNGLRTMMKHRESVSGM